MRPAPLRAFEDVARFARFVSVAAMRPQMRYGFSHHPSRISPFASGEDKILFGSEARPSTLSALALGIRFRKQQTRSILGFAIYLLPFRLSKRRERGTISVAICAH